VGGKRELQIIVGPYEAVAILRHLSGMKEQRPLTHDLTKNLIEKMGGEIKKITVNDLRSDIYYAIISLVMDGQEIEVDSRPSDAIALAVRFGAPIYVAEKVIEEAKSAVKEMGESAEDLEVEERFREIMEGLDFDEPA
jgi:hypothetical protein